MTLTVTKFNNISQCHTSVYLIYKIKNINLTVTRLLSCIYNLICILVPRYLQHINKDNLESIGIVNSMFKDYNS